MPRDRKERLKRLAEQTAYKEGKRIAAIRARVPLTVIGAETRACGECQACCFVVGVEGNHLVPRKDIYTACPQQCATGCAVYSQRPADCKEYKCVWLQGMLTGEGMRPDQLGVILDERVSVGNRTGQVVPTIGFWEVWAGAYDTPKVQALVQWVKQNMRHCRVAVWRYGEEGDGTGLSTKPLT